MKKLLSTWMLVLVFALMSGTAFAIGFCKDIAPTDPPDKTFDDEWTMNVGEEIEFDVYINDVPEALTYAGVWISYDVSPIPIFPNDLQIYDGVNGPPGPWDSALTYISPPCGGLPPCPTIFFVGNAEGVHPDEDGDIILGRIKVHSLYEGHTDILVSTFPSIDTVIGQSETVYDPQIIPNTITIHQIPPPSCECVELASDPPTYFIEHYQEIQFIPITTGTCEPHNWQYSIDCFQGDVDPVSGLFTVFEITADEICTVTATDQANTGVTCYSEVYLIFQVRTDYDMDGVANYEDNCINTPNGFLGGTCTSGTVGEFCDFINDDCGIDGFCSEDQEDSYPPQGNNIGDACDCEGNFDCHRDSDVDGTDAATFKLDFGRSPFNNPCNSDSQCNGDFDCDNDCDGSDAALFKQDFGRSSFNNPCPACVVGEWCVYQ